MNSHMLSLTHSLARARARSLSHTHGPGGVRPALCTRGSEDRFGIPKPRESGSVSGADWRRSGSSCVLPKGVPQGQTESGGIVLAVICWSPSGGVTRQGDVLNDLQSLLDCQ
jgi:hypothetical protein